MLKSLLGVLISALLAAPAALADSRDLVVMDPGARASAYREGAVDVRTTPASTFKIPLALMGFDSGLLTDADHPVWAYQDSYRETRPEVRTDISPRSWLAVSAVWYSRELTRRLGPDAFQKYVDAFQYGNRDLSGDPGKNNGLSQAWLGSSLKISPLEQVRFLADFLAGDLPVSREALESTRSIVPVFEGPGGWTIHGKTGTSFQKTDGVGDPRRQIGWFVGWGVKGERILVFALRRVEEQSPAEGTAGQRARDELLGLWPPGLSPGPNSEPASLDD